MTAYETSARINERLQTIGPVIEAMLGDLKNELRRVYSIMERKGLIDPPPKSLQGIPITIEFVSLLALAAKAAATGGIERLSAYVGNLVAVYPEIKFDFDASESVREMGDLLGVPPKVVRGMKEARPFRRKRRNRRSKPRRWRPCSMALKRRILVRRPPKL